MSRKKNNSRLSMESLMTYFKKQRDKTDKFQKNISFVHKSTDRLILNAEITGTDSMGDLIARPLTSQDKKRIPQIILTADRLSPPAGVGDIVRIRIHTAKNGQFEGEALKRLSDNNNRITGVFENGFVTPTDRRLKYTYQLSGYKKGSLKNGDLIIVEIPPEYSFNASAVLIQKFGKISDPFAPTNIALMTHNLHTNFSENAQVQAAKINPYVSVNKTHTDYTHIPFVTIDGFDARDFDDAVFAEKDPNPQNNGGWHVMVAIADVAYYVNTDSALDKEAFSRGNSIYFPDRVIPMLPFELSSGMCSLKPNEKRYALICDLILDRNGYKIKHTFKRGIIQSQRQLTYNEVQAFLDNKKSLGSLDTEINALYQVYLLLKKNRQQRGALNIDLPERQVTLNKNGQVTQISLREQTDSMKLIEELMILANVAAAETLEEKNTLVMYRVHDRPSYEKIQNLNYFLKTLSVPVKPLKESSSTDVFNALLDRFKNRDECFALNENVLRTQSQACYTPENIGHFGLALSRYAHFTSPIRRYADLMVHRALITALHLGNDGLTESLKERFYDIGEHISHTERRADTAERDAIERYIARFMYDKVGKVFEVIVASVTQFGLFVRTIDGFADGFIPMRALTDDFYDYDDIRQEIVGRNTAKTYRLGDKLNAVLQEATPVTGGLLFSPKSKRFTSSTQKRKKYNARRKKH